MIARIAVSAATYAIDRPYSYSIPRDLTLEPGVRVMVPFGAGNRRTEGLVLSVESGDETGLKSVDQRLDDQPVLSPVMLRLAGFMRERYFCTLFDAVRAMLPAGLWFRSRETFTLVPDSDWKSHRIRNGDALRLLELLEELGGQADDRMAAACIPDEDARIAALRYLRSKKWIRCEQDFLRRAGDKTEQIASLAASAEEVMEYARRPRTGAAQRAVLEALCGVGSASVKELCYFTGAKPATVRSLEKAGCLTLETRPMLRCREIRPAVLNGPLTLNEEQQTAFDGLSSQMGRENPGVALLYGVTGSGKTSVYLKLIAESLEQGKAAMLLVPEIALTPQLLGLLAAHFGDTVAVLHSSLSVGERYDQWRRVRDGQANVVVGTRSAVFAPCPNLGLLILDEEQEHTYKSENSPRYTAKEIAIWRGNREGALVLFGSATPSIETMYRAKQGDYALYRLENRYNGRPLPRVQIVDLREELRSGNDLIFSTALQEAMLDTFGAGKQTVLLLNRRGNSRALVCVDCRESPECPRCSARLTYHSANERLMCHYCGHSQRVSRKCPRCGGAFKPIGIGTQKAEQELQALLPQVQIARMDADTVNAVNTHEAILDRFQSEHMGVLLGTQMVAKGLNLPDVTLVGVLDADLSLYSDSFRAAETTFNLLTQVVGRAGRGNAEGSAMIQTMAPNHAVITLAAKQDYEGFYELESNLRRAQALPPFADVAVVTFTGLEEGAVLRCAMEFRERIRANRFPGQVLGPAPCPVPKINNRYRYRLTLRGQFNKPLRQMLAAVLREFLGDRKNRGVSAFADINGYD